MMPVIARGPIVTYRLQWSMYDRYVMVPETRAQGNVVSEKEIQSYIQCLGRCANEGWILLFKKFKRHCIRPLMFTSWQSSKYCVLEPLEVSHSSTPALVLQDRPTKQKTNGNKGPDKRREAAVTVTVGQRPLRVFFNPDTCKPFHHDLQWGKHWLGAGRPPEGLFSQQMMRNTLNVFSSSSRHL